MKFKNLEMTGFKSFSEKTTVLIEKGLTGIVGPNGCGKSNIVEALRWCMGENSAKSMRGSGMEDVIFSGTSNRPSKNISEVLLKLDNQNKEGPAQYKEFDEILIKRKIERDKGSKYYINDKEVRAKDVQTLFADLSTGAHSPSLISQGRIGQLVTAKPSERKSILEEAAGISGIHARRQEAETRLNAAENNLKRADELKKQQQKQLDNLKKQAEEATRYKEISNEIKKVEAGLYYLKVREIEKDKKKINEKLSELDDEISAVNIDLNHNNTLLEEENKKLSPLRDKKMESAATLQKLNLDMSNLVEEESRVKSLQEKLEKSIKTIESDLEREKSISLDAELNEKRILKEKEELFKTEDKLLEVETNSSKELKNSKIELDNLQNKLNDLLDGIEKDIDQNKKLTKETFRDLKKLVKSITSSQEEYAEKYGKNKSIQSDSIKRKERIKNIDVELENWRNLKSNSEKMMSELNERKNKILLELSENQKNWRAKLKEVRGVVGGQTPPGYGPTKMSDAQHKDGKNVRQVSAWLQNEDYGEKPFFIACGLHKPHVPFWAPQKYFDMHPLDTIKVVPNPANDWDDIPPKALVHRYEAFGFERGIDNLALRKTYMQAYHACVSFVDSQIAELWKVMDEKQLWENTIVIFISDHGYHLGEHFLWGKVSLFEECARVPMLIHAPGVTTAGSESESLVELVDLVPTVCQLAEVDTPGYVQGVSIVPVLMNPHDVVKKQAYTVVSRGEGDLGRSIRTNLWRFADWGNQQFELYDLKNDPREIMNRISDSPKVQQLQRLLKASKSNASREN